MPKRSKMPSSSKKSSCAAKIALKKDSSEYLRLKREMKKKSKYDEDTKTGNTERLPKQREMHDALFGANSPFDHKKFSNHFNNLRRKIDTGTLSTGA